MNSAPVAVIGACLNPREFDAPPVCVQQALIGRFIQRIGRTPSGVLLSDCHRWRHARVEAPLGEPFLLDREAGIGFCGDVLSQG